MDLKVSLVEYHLMVCQGKENSFPTLTESNLFEYDLNHDIADSESLKRCIFS